MSKEITEEKETTEEIIETKDEFAAMEYDATVEHDAATDYDTTTYDHANLLSYIYDHANRQSYTYDHASRQSYAYDHFYQFFKDYGKNLHKTKHDVLCMFVNKQEEDEKEVTPGMIKDPGPFPDIGVTEKRGDATQ